MPGTKRTILYLEGKFETGDVPTQEDFYDLFASFIHYQQLLQTTGTNTELPMSQDAVTDAIAAVVQHFRGVYVSLVALQTAVPTGTAGDYAFVDTGIGGSPSLYVWDSSDNAWVIGGSAPTPNGSETVAGVFEESTDGETAAGTTTGATGARLVINPAKLLTWWTAIKAANVAWAARLTAKHLAASHGSLTDAATIAWDADTIGNFGTVTLGGNRTLGAISNPLAGAIYGIRVVQDGTGGRTLAFNAQYTFPGTITPILNSAIGEATNFLFFYDGTNMRYLNASGNYKLSDLFLTNQVAAGSDKRPIWIDSTGKLQKSTFVNYDETNKKETVTGNATTNTVMFEMLNSALDTIAKFYNDQIVEFGGGTAVISILSAVISGGAYLEMNSNQAEGFRIIDKASQSYVTFATTTGGQAVYVLKKVKHDQGVGFEKWHIQAFVRTSGSAGVTNYISSVALPTDSAGEVTINHLMAYATDNTVVIADGGRFGVAKNVAGTVSGTFGTFTVLSVAAGTTATWSMVADNTNKRININFVNTTGTGKTFDVSLDYTYVVRLLPV